MTVPSSLRSPLLSSLRRCAFALDSPLRINVRGSSTVWAKPSTSHTSVILFLTVLAWPVKMKHRRLAKQLQSHRRRRHSTSLATSSCNDLFSPEHFKDLLKSVTPACTLDLFTVNPCMFAFRRNLIQNASTQIHSLSVQGDPSLDRSFFRFVREKNTGKKRNEFPCKNMVSVLHKQILQAIIQKNNWPLRQPMNPYIGVKKLIGLPH